MRDLNINKKIGIVKYSNFGNIRSITNAISQLNFTPILVSHKKHLSKVSKIIVPGVGSFKKAMQFLKISELDKEITTQINKKYFLGICIGMHILATNGEEFGICNGLNLISGKVKKIPDVTVPNFGFKKVNVCKKNSLMKNHKKNYFYFMHSYELLVNNENLIISNFNIGNKKMISLIKKDNIYGVQFHPEKSRQNGLNFLNNFLLLK